MKPRVLSVKEMALEEKAPPSDTEFEFIEKWEPEEEKNQLPQAPKPASSFLDRIKSLFRF